MAGQVFHNCTITWNGSNTLTGQTNRVEITRERSTVSWENFGDDKLNKDQGARNETIRLSMVYTQGAAEAYKALNTSFEGTNGGTAGTLVVTPVASGSIFTAVGKVASLTAAIPKGEVGTLEAVIEPTAGITWTAS